MTRQRIIIAISGASGAAYGLKALVLLRPLKHIETHLVVSQAAHLTCMHECQISKNQLEKLADVIYPVTHIGAAIASGSFKTMGMLIAPCSMRTLSAIDAL